MYRITTITNLFVQSGILRDKVDSLVYDFQTFQETIEMIKQLKPGDTNFQKFKLRLNNFESNFNSLHLLSVYYRGYFYHSIQEKNNMTSLQLAEKLNVSVTHQFEN